MIVAIGMFLSKVVVGHAVVSLAKLAGVKGILGIGAAKSLGAGTSAAAIAVA